ncbi:uncharacterized protein VICG_01378 [Vittaforma corneae ATCC 50505]|uniref:Uncharacterized protein n=1 Tax=Vittaforma corneae (strain ATCC 50505) TaxID=993615 RepID=L2GMC5_VITCO|nr:uncharacterized protein VICG_01378 [Vittaforma corneae ATCC 50505]ELA41630.1 hypothetical protein VICG_01378 [Vittaforma corneae ATCC 50505]
MNNSYKRLQEESRPSDDSKCKNVEDDRKYYYKIDQQTYLTDGVNENTNNHMKKIHVDTLMNKPDKRSDTSSLIDGFSPLTKALQGDRNSLLKSPYNGLELYNEYFNFSDTDNGRRLGDPYYRQSNEAFNYQQLDSCKFAVQRQFYGTFESYYGCIHSETECKSLIEKAKKGEILTVKKRLNQREKTLIRPGSVFVYTEEESNVKRWTDKKEWSPSRVQGCFLVYKELHGQLMKKTYASSQNDGIYHVVAYTLMSWDIQGTCCEYFRVQLGNSQRPICNAKDTKRNDLENNYSHYPSNRRDTTQKPGNSHFRMGNWNGDHNNIEIVSDDDYQTTTFNERNSAVTSFSETGDVDIPDTVVSCSERNDGFPRSILDVISCNEKNCGGVLGENEVIKE